MHEKEGRELIQVPMATREPLVDRVFGDHRESHRQKGLSIPDIVPIGSISAAGADEGLKEVVVGGV
jgi:hypothetical protein